MLSLSPRPARARPLTDSLNSLLSSSAKARQTLERGKRACFERMKESSETLFLWLGRKVETVKVYTIYTHLAYKKRTTISGKT